MVPGKKVTRKKKGVIEKYYMAKKRYERGGKSSRASSREPQKVPNLGGGKMEDAVRERQKGGSSMFKKKWKKEVGREVSQLIGRGG